MADSTIKPSEMPTIPSITGSEVLIISTANSTYKCSVTALAEAILSSMQFATLSTTDKTIIGAINEIGGN